jgi:hypothetical protein
MAFPNPQNLGLEVSHLCIIDSKRYFCGHFAPAKVARSRHLREWGGGGGGGGGRRGRERTAAPLTQMGCSWGFTLTTFSQLLSRLELSLLSITSSYLRWWINSFD